MDDFYMKNLYPKLIFYYFKPHFQKQTRDVKEKSKKKKKKVDMQRSFITSISQYSCIFLA